MPGTLNVGGHDIITHSGDAGAGDVTVNVQNRLVLDSSGNVGVGTSSPAQKLHVEKDGSAVATFRTSNNDSSGGIELCGKNSSGTIQPFYIQSGTSSELKFSQGTSGIQRMMIDSSGNVLVGTTSAFGISSAGNMHIAGSNFSPLYLRNTASTAGDYWRVGPSGATNTFTVYNQSSTGVYISDGNTSWAASSDERLKTDLIPIENGVEKVATLRAVTGRFKTDDENKSRSFLIAQDVQKVLPEAVHVQDDEQGTLGLAYTDIIPLLVAAIKEYKFTIESQQSQIDALTARIEALETT